MGEIAFRPYKESDLNFIRSSWSSSYYRGADYTKFMSPKEFNDQHRPIRDELLLSPNVAIIIACNPNDEDLILGWILVETKEDQFILHYLYVKEVFRREGLGRELVRKAINDNKVQVTHMTGRAQKIIRSFKAKYKDFSFAKKTIMIRDKYYNTLARGISDSK